MNLDNLISLTKPVRIHQNRCIRSFSVRSTCTKCIQQCPHHAIEFTNGVIEINNCAGCGRCVQACVHDVFEMDFPSALQIEKKPYILACKKHGRIDLPVVAVECLQQFTFLQLAIMVKQIGDVYLYCDEKECEQCPENWFPEGQLMLMERYGLEKYKDKIHIIKNEEVLWQLLNKESVIVNERRAYIKNQLESVKSVASQYTKETVEAYTSAVTETLNINSQSFEKTQSHALLLAELYSHQEFLVDKEIPLQKLENTKCRLCHICENLCPWEALAIIEENGHAVLAHHDVLCARCGLCVDLCPEKGLFWNMGLSREGIYHPHWRVLAELDEKQCERCGEGFYPTEEKQSVCAFCKNKV